MVICVVASQQRSSEQGSCILVHRMREEWGRRELVCVSWLACCPPVGRKERGKGSKGRGKREGRKKVGGRRGDIKGGRERDRSGERRGEKEGRLGGREGDRRGEGRGEEGEEGKEYIFQMLMDVRQESHLNMLNGCVEALVDGRTNKLNLQNKKYIVTYSPIIPCYGIGNTASCFGHAEVRAQVISQWSCASAKIIVTHNLVSSPDSTLS